MTQIELFAGIGGFGLAGHWAEIETVCQVEIDPFCQRVLQKNFPNAHRHDDIRTFDAKTWRGVDIISGGFPCQDISNSGLGAGIVGSKSGLWKEYLRCIREARPGYAIIENVRAITAKGLDVVLCDLAGIGYDAEWSTFFAADFGLPHIRPRTFILAYPNVSRRRGLLFAAKASCYQTNCAETRKSLDYSGNHFLRFEQSVGEPAIFRMDDGVPDRPHVVKRLGACGNAIVPQVAYQIFKAIKAQP